MQSSSKNQASSANYIKNCFWLLVLPLVWNVLFMSDLPANYVPNSVWDSIPPSLELTEHVLRIITFLLPLGMALSFKSRSQKVGLAIYTIGVLVYFMSWYIQMTQPNSLWSQSLLGYAAPAYTPLIWLIGIGLIGETSFIKSIPLRTLYFLFVGLFISVHTYHAYLAHLQL